MQHLALALEGPAVECLKKVREEEPGAYNKLWAILAHRFGYLDEPERAMRKFDSRRQLDGESVAEYEQALRTLYREAWPKADEVTRDAALKRKFEEGLGSGEMLQFLRLHARQDDFSQTVAKARRFAETQKEVKPKKAVRILEAPERDRNAESVQVGMQNFQPLLDGFEIVIQTVLQNNTQPTVGCAESKINQVRVGVVTPETLRDGTNARLRQLRATAASAQPVMTTSSNGPLVMGTAHTVLDQGPTSTMGRDVRVTDVVHPHHQAEVIRTVQATEEVGAMARTQRGRVGHLTLIDGTKISVPGRGIAAHRDMDLQGTNGSTAMVEVVGKDTETGDVGITRKASTNLKVETNRKVGTSHRAKCKVSTSKVHHRAKRHHRTRYQIEEMGTQDKVKTKVKVVIQANRGWT